MNIADKIIESQDVKEMTRKAIKVILAIDHTDPIGLELAEEFLAEYGEPVEPCPAQ